MYRLSIFNSNAYDAAKSTGDVINNQWNSVVRTYSNADLPISDHLVIATIGCQL